MRDTASGLCLHGWTRCRRAGGGAIAGDGRPGAAGLLPQPRPRPFTGSGSSRGAACPAGRAERGRIRWCWPGRNTCWNGPTGLHLKPRGAARLGALHAGPFAVSWPKERWRPCGWECARVRGTEVRVGFAGGIATWRRLRRPGAGRGGGPQSSAPGLCLLPQGDNHAHRRGPDHRPARGGADLSEPRRIWKRPCFRWGSPRESPCPKALSTAIRPRRTGGDGALRPRRRERPVRENPAGLGLATVPRTWLVANRRIESGFHLASCGNLPM